VEKSKRWSGFITDDALDWGKYVGIDEDGTARVFKKKPIKIGKVWVPDKFPKQMYPACYEMKTEYPEHLHGRKLKRKSGEYIPAV